MSDYTTLRQQAGLSDLSRLGLVVATGPERVKYLQSILSQDIEHLNTAGESALSLLLSPKGKVEHGLILLAVEDDTMLLVTEEGRADQLADDLNRWRIRVKCEIATAGDSWGLFEVRGPDATGIDGAPWDWPGLPGRLIPVRRDQAVPDVAPVVGWDAREVVRIEAGVPRIGPGLDADESTIPQEAFLDRDMVSFTKGCFLGQELVCRIDTRGHVNRYLRSLLVSGDVIPTVGATVSHSGKDVGRVTSAGLSPELGPVALGYVRREVELPALVSVRWDEGEADAEARVSPLVD